MTIYYPRRGFTMLETLVALGALATVSVAVAQLGMQTMAERQRNTAQLAAVESAVNVLEAARAIPWDRLTPEWAAAQRLPESVAQRLQDSALAVTVAAEPDRPGVKRVTVDVTWRLSDRFAAQPVTMTALFAQRSGGPAP